MAEIRACTPDDIPAVAELFQRTFVDRQRAAPEALKAYLLDLFLRHPWHDPELTSRVYVAADGAIGGFIGVLPLKMSFRGTPVRAAVAGSLMVDKPDENPLAGARLLRSFVTGPQALSISETANQVSCGMWERLGGQSVPYESMEWLRIFHPAGLAVALAGETFAPAKIFRPVASLADRIGGKIAGNPFRLDVQSTGVSDADVSDEMLLDLIPALASDYPLRPAWDASCLTRLLAHAAHKSRYGTLFRRVVHGRNNAPLGCYLYYAKPRHAAWVLQILARPDAADAVIDNLLLHASRQGCVAVRGRTQPRLMDALLRRHCIFFRRSSTVVHSADPELMATIRAGDALMIGLAGESWTRLIGHTFA